MDNEARSHLNTILKTIWNLAKSGASDDDLTKFYDIATAPGYACEPEKPESIKPKINAALEEHFRKPWPGAPSEPPAAVEPRTNVAANTPIGLLAQFRGSWPGAPMEARR